MQAINAHKLLPVNGDTKFIMKARCCKKCTTKLSIYNLSEYCGAHSSYNRLNATTVLSRRKQCQ